MNLETISDYYNWFVNPRHENVTPLGRWVWFTWRQRITATGRVLLLVLLVAGTVSSVIGVTTPLYFFAVFLFMFFLVGRMAVLIFGPRVQVHRSLPERCAAGAVVRVQAQVKNTGMLGVFDLGVSERMPHMSIELSDEVTYLDYLAPGRSTRLEYTLEPGRRGVYDFKGPVAITAFPFGVYNHSRKFDAPARMIVYPRFMPLADVDLPTGRRHQPGGLQMVSHVGDSEEFLGNREYRPGDRLRDIHYQSWARVGFPVVREYRQEYLCRIAMIVDTFVPGRGIVSGAARRDLEAGLSLAAAIADVLSRREYVIDIFAAGPDLYHFQAGRSLAYLDNILDILACIEPCRHNPFTAIAPVIMEEISQISTAVVVMLDWNREREEFVRSLSQFGVAIKAFVVRSGEPTFDPSGFVTTAGPVKVLTPEQVTAGIDRL